jgi:O-antigen ligase
MKSSKKKTAAILRLLIYGSPFVLPLYLLRFQVVGIPFTAMEVYTYALFAYFIARVGLRHHQISWKKPEHYYYLLAFGIFIGATLGIAAAPHFITLPSGEIMDAQQTAMGIWKGWIVAPLLYFFVIAQTLRSQEEVGRLLQNLVYAAAALALTAYVAGIVAQGFTYDFRLAGIYESANYLALFLVPAFILSVYYWLFEPAELKKERLLNFSAMVILAHALVFTQSYAAILGVFGAFGLFTLHSLFLKRSSVKKILGILTALIVLFGVLLISLWNTPKFQQFIDLKNRSSSSVRLEIYDVSVNLITRYPLTGIGPGLFQAHYQTEGPEILGQAPMEWNMPHSHNLFLAFWLNTGLIGFLAFILILVFAHRRFTYPLIALWGVLIHGLFDTPFWKNDLAMEFWILIAAILILQTYETDSAKKQSSPIRRRLNPKVSGSAKAKRI